MRLGPYIRYYRQDNNITLQEFANRCGLSKAFISMIENERNPKTHRPFSSYKLETLMAIANAMNMSTKELFDEVEGLTVMLPGAEEELPKERKPSFDSVLLQKYYAADPVTQANIRLLLGITEG